MEVLKPLKEQIWLRRRSYWSRLWHRTSNAIYRLLWRALAQTSLVRCIWVCESIQWTINDRFCLPCTCYCWCPVIKASINWKLIWIIQITKLGNLKFTSKIYIRCLNLTLSGTNVAEISFWRLIWWDIQWWLSCLLNLSLILVLLSIICAEESLG